MTARKPIFITLVVLLGLLAVGSGASVTATATTPDPDSLPEDPYAVLMVAVEREIRQTEPHITSVIRIGKQVQSKSIVPLNAPSVNITLSPADGERVEPEFEITAKASYSGLVQTPHAARIQIFLDGVVEVHSEDFPIPIGGSGTLFTTPALVSGISPGRHELSTIVKIERIAPFPELVAEDTDMHTILVDNDPPDDICSQADTNTFNVGDTIPQGNLEFGGDHDWARIIVPDLGGMAVTLDIPSDPFGVDYQLEVWDDSCSTNLFLSDNPPGCDESITLPVTSGAYRVHIYGATSSDFGTPYQLATSFNPKLTADNPVGGAQFGWPVAISGDIAVIGITPGPYLPGAAYVFQRNGVDWNQVKKLTASTPTPGDWFGRSVAISGNIVVVGAAFDNGGVAYIFERSMGGPDNWGLVKTLSTSETDDLFGCSVAISGDTVVIGARGDDGSSGDWFADFGAAHIFGRNEGGTNNWGWVVKLTASDAARYDAFGESVAISGDTVVIGTPADDDRGTNSGSAYVFERGTGWSNGSSNQRTKLTASDATAQDTFGSAVAISGNTVVVGGFWSDAAYVFEKSSTGWPLTTRYEDVKLVARDTRSSYNFGVSVAIDGDTVVIGDHYGPGAAYIFQRSGVNWGQVKKLTASDADSDDAFGRSVAISGDIIVVGDPGADNGGTNSGAAYIYDGFEPDLPTFNIRAFIEGRSRLKVRVYPPNLSPAYITWHHIAGVAPGRLGGERPSLINQKDWFPQWPDVPDQENRDCNCSPFSAFCDPARADQPHTVILEVVEAREGGSVEIIEQPADSDDGFNLIVEFDDTGIGGAEWYEINLYYLEQPTAIDLLSFTARPGTDHITLAWETGTEVDNAGFNLWRGEAADGPYTKLNDTLIPAEGDPVAGASYTYTDTDVVKEVTYYYKLEDVDTHGISAWHGPVSATPSPIRRIYLPLLLK